MIIALDFSNATYKCHRNKVSELETKLTECNHNKSSFMHISDPRIQCCDIFDGKSWLESWFPLRISENLLNLK